MCYKGNPFSQFIIIYYTLGSCIYRNAEVASTYVSLKCVNSHFARGPRRKCTSGTSRYKRSVSEAHTLIPTEIMESPTN